MFAKLSIALLSLSLLAVATPWAAPTTTTQNTVTTTVTVTETATATPESQCNTGDIQCCNSVQDADTPSTATLLSDLGIVVQGGSVPIGITCSPVSIAGIGGDSCSSTPVCCENNSFNGVVAIGCVPIIINA